MATYSIAKMVNWWTEIVSNLGPKKRNHFLDPLFGPPRWFLIEQMQKLGPFSVHILDLPTSMVSPVPPDFVILAQHAVALEMPSEQNADRCCEY